MNVKLIGAIPELAGADADLREWWAPQEPPPHPYYGEVLNEYLIMSLEAGTNKEVLERIFSFLEELMNNDDERVSNVVAVTVCERLINKKEWIEAARQFMRPETLKMSREIEAAWVDLNARYGEGRR